MTAPHTHRRKMTAAPKAFGMTRTPGLRLLRWRSRSIANGAHRPHGRYRRRSTVADAANAYFCAQAFRVRSPAIGGATRQRRQGNLPEIYQCLLEKRVYSLMSFLFRGADATTPAAY